MKNVLITGAAGGLGSAAAKYFASRGARVFAADLRPVRGGANIVPLTMDVTSQSSVDAACSKVSAMCGGLSAVLNFAGIYGMSSLAEISEGELKRHMEVNFYGCWRVNKAFLPLVRAGKGRIIITTSELACRKPLPFNGLYTLTKTALEHYADSLRLELALLGVPVITLRPGAFDTALLEASTASMKRMLAETKLYSGYRSSAAAFTAVMASQHGRAHDPERLAAVAREAAFSPSPRPQYTVGASALLALYGALPLSVQRAAILLLLGKNKTK